jgi:small subunit ribosomal protein S1
MKGDSSHMANATDTKKLTMADLLAQPGRNLQIPHSGDIISGKVVDITKKMILLDIGAKTEGLVVDREFQAAKEMLPDLKPGEKIDVFVLDSENEQGQILLSVRRAVMDRKWDDLIQLVESQETVQVEGVEVNKGGMVVMLDGLRGFIPTSQFGRQVTGKLDSLKGQMLDVKVLESDKEKNRLIFSERLVSEADEIANSDRAVSAVKPGDVVSGTVTGVKPFGVFVAVEVPVDAASEGQEAHFGVLEGMVHISEVSWDKVEDLTKLYDKGQKIETKVVSVDKDQKKLTLSLKQLQNDPWDKLAQECPPGTTVTGTVSRIVPFGVFVSIVGGVDGLIHESKLEGREYEEGKKISVVIDSIDSDQRRVSLSPTTDELPVTYK